MIKITDIRIGNNLLLYGEVVKVTEIGSKDDDFYLRVEGKNNGYYIDQFEPIRLNDTIHQILSNTDFLLNYNDNLGENWSEYWIEFKGVNLKRVRYLHEVQNLYWCIVGKELEIIGNIHEENK